MQSEAVETKRINLREVFAGLQIVLSTPHQNGMASEQYADSRAELERTMFNSGIQFAIHKVRDTYLPRARNILAAAFMDTGAPWQLQLDSDMGWNVADVMKMLYYAHTTPEIEIIGAPYPQKAIDYDRLKEVVLRNPKITKEQMAACATGAWTFKGLATGKYNLDVPVPLEEIGPQKPHVATGVMLVKRSVYETLKPHAPEFVQDHTQKPAWEFFDSKTSKNAWVGEDTWLCRKWHDLGKTLWLAPWVRTTHLGAMLYVGDLGLVMESGADLPV